MANGTSPCTDSVHIHSGAGQTSTNTQTGECAGARAREHTHTVVEFYYVQMSVITMADSNVHTWLTHTHSIMSKKLFKC